MLEEGRDQIPKQCLTMGRVTAEMTVFVCAAGHGDGLSRSSREFHGSAFFRFPALWAGVRKESTAPLRTGMNKLNSQSTACELRATRGES